MNRMMLLLLSIAVLPLSTTANAAMTEQQCESQANAVPHLLKMVEDGTMPATEKQLEKLKEAQGYLSKGEYCAAREIVLNLDKNG